MQDFFDFFLQIFVSNGCGTEVRKAERHAQLMIDLIREIASPLTTEVEYPAP